MTSLERRLTALERAQDETGRFGFVFLDTPDGTPPQVERALMRAAFTAAGKRVPSHFFVFVGCGETGTAQVPDGPVVYLDGGRDAVAD